MEQSQKIVFKELPCITANVDIALPPPEWDKVISESEKIKIANREAAEKIGCYIVDNGLCEIIRNYDVEFNREKVRYKIRVVQPPNEYRSIDQVHKDPKCYDEALKFYQLDGD